MPRLPPPHQLPSVTLGNCTPVHNPTFLRNCRWNRPGCTGACLDCTRPCPFHLPEVVSIPPYPYRLPHQSTSHPTSYWIPVPCDCLWSRRPSPCIPSNCSCSRRDSFALPGNLHHPPVSDTTQSRLPGADKLSSLLAAPLTCRHIRAKVVRDDDFKPPQDDLQTPERGHSFIQPKQLDLAPNKMPADYGTDRPAFLSFVIPLLPCRTIS